MEENEEPQPKLDPDVQEFVSLMNNSLASLEDAKIVPPELWDFEATI